jgi:biopolymer transport protein ExbB/TolQ
MHLVSHLKTVLLDFQAGWVMWILLGLSAVSLVLMLERALAFRRLRVDLGDLSRRLDEALRAGDYRAALELVRSSRSPEAAVVVAGLKMADLGPASAEKAMQGAMVIERVRLERGLTFLGTLGNNAPFIGLLGTVIGVIEAFESLGKPDPSGAAAGISQQAIMTGISEALVATAVGLFVAIPSVVAYNFFTRRVQESMANGEALSDLLLAHLNAEAPALPSMPLAAGRPEQ